MVGLISVVGRRPAPDLFAIDQLQRLEQAAGFSMVACETEDDLDEQPAGRAVALKDVGEAGVSRRMSSFIDDCAAVVTSYLRRPAF